MTEDRDYKLKVLMDWDDYDIETRDIDPEEDFFELGMLEMAKLIDSEMNLTDTGEKEFKHAEMRRLSRMFGHDPDNEG
ncbi:MAG: hypothetical protein KKB34_12585 [Bacteroidetes bacterium]|nr:hypothetical protein [Bacteroidota bacterium]